MVHAHSGVLWLVCVVGAKVKHLLALPSLCCRAVSAALSLFGLGAIYCV